jgi:uncharacterized protein (DUF2336 family)
VAQSRIEPAIGRTKRDSTQIAEFLARSQSMDAELRAAVAGKLAQAYLLGRSCARLKSTKRSMLARLETLTLDVEACLAALVQDASRLVRRALSEVFAGAALAPRYIVLALANDEPDIAHIVIRQSPILTDAELLEFATDGDETTLCVIAQRSHVSDVVAASLLESGMRSVCIALLSNSEANIASYILRRIADKFADDGVIRDALLARSDLPAEVRYDVVETTLMQVSLAWQGSKKLQRHARQTADVLRYRTLLRSTVGLEISQLCDLVNHLRTKRALTMCLLMRSLVSGNRAVFEATAVELTGLRPLHAIALTQNHRSAAFRALYHRMGLPAQFLTPVRVAIAALDDIGPSDTGLISRPIVSRVIEECESVSPELGHLIALLRRWELEAALDEGRNLANLATVKQRSFEQSVRSEVPNVKDFRSINGPECQSARVPDCADALYINLGYKAAA